MLQYIGSPETTTGVLNGQRAAQVPATFNGADSSILGSTFENVHDASLHFVSKLADRRLQIDVIAGYHYDEQTNTPGAGGNDLSAFYQPVQSLATFESNVTPCAPTMTHGVAFNPCPVQNYTVGGVGFLDHKTSQRISAAASATYFARLAGTHALKLGFDFEDNIFAHIRNYTGGALFRVNTDGSIEIYREYAQKSADADTNPNGQGIPLPATGFNSTEKTLNFGAYLRDSYNVGFIPGLTINAGVRWEGAAGPGRRRLDPDRHLRQLGAARRRDLRLHAQGPRQDLRQLRLVLRVDPDRHQRSLVLARRLVPAAPRRAAPACPTCRASTTSIPASRA